MNWSSIDIISIIMNKQPTISQPPTKPTITSTPTITLGNEKVPIAQGTVPISSQGVSIDKAIEGLGQAISKGVFSPSPSLEQEVDQDESSSK